MALALKGTMVMDTAKVMQLTHEIQDLERKLEEARAALVSAVTGAASAPVPVVPVAGNAPLRPRPTITDTILGFAEHQRHGFRVGELLKYLKDQGYSGDRNSINARVHALERQGRLKKIGTGVFQKA